MGLLKIIKKRSKLSVARQTAKRNMTTKFASLCTQRIFLLVMLLEWFFASSFPLRSAIHPTIMDGFSSRACSEVWTPAHCFGREMINSGLGRRKKIIGTSKSQMNDSSESTTAEATTAKTTTMIPSIKNDLLEMLLTDPANVASAATTSAQTKDILKLVRRLEMQCPTDASKVIQFLAGSWELLWTTQDPESPESNRLFGSWINPLENQSYSNKNKSVTVTGRLNPVLPKPIQDMLEDASLITTSNDDSESKSSSTVRSTQAIDIKRGTVRNVVAFELPLLKRKASLTVLVKCKPNLSDQRRIDVKFDSCRIVLLPPTGSKNNSISGSFANKSLDVTIPLGIVGPTGWLRTTYIDDDLRVTRGHKGSVFVLSRKSSQQAKS